MKRQKTNYPGVFFINGKSSSNNKIERIFYINYYKNGKRIEEKAGRQFSDDMTAAKANNMRSFRIEGKQLSNVELREKEYEIKLTKNVWTIDKLWNEFHFQKSEEGLKSLRDDVYRYNNYLLKSFGHKEPSELKVSDTDRLRIDLSKHLKPQTVKHILSLLQRIISFGFKKQLIPLLTFKIEMPKFDNQVTETLTRDQVSKLLRVLNEDNNTNIANLMKLALFTGMRRSELFSLKWDDIDLENEFIRINEPKSGKTEKIPINDAVKEILQDQKRTKSPYLFPGQSGKKLMDIKTSVNRIKAKAELPKNFRPLHGLRHTFASMLASSGKVDMYTLQKLLTHKSPQMTQRYAHLRDETLKKASNVAANLFESLIEKK